MLNFKNWFQILETDVTKLESTSSMADLQYLALKTLNMYRECVGGKGKCALSLSHRQIAPKPAHTKGSGKVNR